MVWNDSDIPIGFLITFRCRATWLHGDIRGSVDRSHNVYGTAKLDHEPIREDYVRSITKGGPIYLDAKRRACVVDAILETCAIRCWHQYAINVRTNHAHVVVREAGEKPEKMLTAFKANSTRMLKERGLWQFDYSPWAEKGSKRWIWTERSLATAIDYVVNGQGDELPPFD